MTSSISLRRRSAADVVGLDIQPGFVAAVQARINGAILADRAAIMPLAADTVRDGEVVDERGLADVLRELFATSGLNKRVRVGIANQRTVLRTLELPPVTDHKELAAAVAFQAQDQVPMPLNNAVLDFHPLGIVETPAGPRQRVVLVAAQRDMVERLIAAVRRAGLSPEGVDLSAFALIRSLYRPNPEQEGRVLYLNVDGLTNLAIAEGKVCRFTRVVGSGLEGIASELAERRGIALTDARELVAAARIIAPPAAAPAADAPRAAPVEERPPGETPPAAPAGDVRPLGPSEVPLPTNAPEGTAAFGESAPVAPPGAPGVQAAGAPDVQAAATGIEPDSPGPAPVETIARATPMAADDAPDTDVWSLLEGGIREISSEVRNSLDFHRSQEGGGEVSHVVMSGSAQDIPGFAQALQLALGVEVRSEGVGLVDERLGEKLATHRLAVATGLASAEAPR